ncbi:MAG: M15 family metallopeptidase, partial [Rubricoccaceae bacterium]|nr:M15 family metallopeptidase [Rubricoccaceae bacterium]
WSVDTPPRGSTRVPVEETARVVDEVTEQDTLPSGFSHLREVAPSIIQEIRYTTSYNFVGEPIDGYEAPECILTTRAANALADVQEELEADGYSLKVYDCYRPQTAVNHFVRWARNDSQTIKRAFYPEEPKGLLFSRGYIARRSGHSRGSTVDLTMVRLPYVEPEPYPDPNEGPLPRCDRPLGERYAEGDLDMGTAYDCLSLLSATESRAVNAEARENRYRLRSVMSRHGFRNYSKEWWHYTLRNEPYEETYFDFPVR